MGVKGDRYFTNYLSIYLQFFDFGLKFVNNIDLALRPTGGKGDENSRFNFFYWKEGIKKKVTKVTFGTKFLNKQLKYNKKLWPFDFQKVT